MVVSSAISGGLCLHSMLYLLSALYLSKRPLKQFTVGAITTSYDRLFHILTTLLLNKFCRNWMLLLLFASFKLLLRVVKLDDSRNESRSEQSSL